MADILRAMADILRAMADILMVVGFQDDHWSRP